MYQPRAYPPRLPDPAGYRTGSHDIRPNELTRKESDTVQPVETAASKPDTRIESVRSRPPSTSRQTSRSHSGSRSGSRAKMYSSGNSVGGEEEVEEVSLAQLQEMRERSKMLRDQVLSVQRTAQAKEGQLQRLRNERLPSDEVTQEADKLTRLQDRIKMQEARLRKLRETKNRIQQQVIINNTMSTELDGLKSLLSNKEKEIGEIDQLVNQLNTRLQQAKIERNSKNSKNRHSQNRIEKLKQEMLAHKRVTEVVQGKFSSQREAVQSKKEEMSKVDLQISELWRKLQQAKALHQQAPLKSATVIAAVGPFEHKPPANSYQIPDSLASIPGKPQEIDIKLIERNGGSGQSSPSVSADEREPYAMRAVKPTPPLPAGSRESPVSMPDSPRDVRSAMARVRSQDGAWSSQGLAKMGHRSPQPEQRNSPEPAAGSSAMLVYGSREESPHIPAGASDPRLHNVGQAKSAASSASTRAGIPSHLLVSSSTRVASPVPRVSSPQPASAAQMKMELGPVRQFNQTNVEKPKMAHSSSDPTIASKLKNFNAKPRPFGVAPQSSQTKQNSGDSPGPEALLSNHKPNQTTSSNQPPDTSSQSDKVICIPAPIGKREDNRSGRDGGIPYSRTYPATPIMGRQQLNSSTNQSASSPPSHRVGSPQQDPAQSNKPSADSPQPRVQSPRYATRSQISDTYIQQVDKEKLEKYRKEMEKAVRDISQNKQETTTPNSSTEDTTPQVSPESPPTSAPTDNVTSPSLTVLAPHDGVTSMMSDMASSEDEKPSDHVEIYNPSEDINRRQLKSIIKKTGEDKPDGLAVSRYDNARFHPLVILLDTALNGTVDEVKQILPKVPDPSASNDEGITALHNAICAGHLDIVQTLVEFGVDVNAVDTDGWTPLHCAASCNNQPVVEYLISRGACILATTYSDSETALEKCEMDEEGYDGTSKCLYDMECKLGVEDPVYCVYDYRAEQADELALRVNDKLSILRRGDKDEQEWWWAKCRDREGYVAKNLLAFSPRVQPNMKKETLLE